jgi:xanthine dehydrogenase accessory factor
LGANEQRPGPVRLIVRHDEVFDALRAWHAEGRRLALATLVDAAGSAPRPIGARLLVADDGRMAGSVSGGCVEGAVISEALRAIDDGRSRLLHYGISDEASWDVGLTCGGEIDVFLEPLDAGRLRRFLALGEAVGAERPVGTAAIVRGPDGLLGTWLAVEEDTVEGGWPLPGLDGLVAAIRASLRAVQPESSFVTVAADRAKPEVPDHAIFASVIAPPPRAWLIGADHVAVYLAKALGMAGFRPIVVDPRASFADPKRFPDAEVRLAWPDEALAGETLDARDYIVVISNDPKIDEPALTLALAGNPAYVGAIGSRHKQEERRASLLASGIAVEQLARLHAPIGLDLGGNEPAELALSIAAELVAVRRGGTGHPMREVRPIMRTGSAGSASR